MIISGKAATTFGIVIFMAVFFVGSFQYSPKSQLLPLVFSSIGLFMALVQLAADLFPGFEQRFGVLRQRGLLGADQIVPGQTDDLDKASDTEPVPDEAAGSDPKRPFEGDALVLVTIVSMLAFALSLIIVPYFVAIPIFILFMLIVVARQNPLVSALIAGGVGSFLFIIFNIVLNTRM